MRVDTTVVETDIHHPTDSSLLGDGVRVLTRIMKKVTAVAVQVGTQLRDRSRSAMRKVLAIARASRNKTETGRHGRVSIRQGRAGLGVGAAREGGMVTFDDYGDIGTTGVKQFVNESIPQPDRLVII